MTYIPSRWHWVVGGDESRYWSGATGAYVQTLPAGAGVTRISDEAELTAVLETHGLVGPIPIRRRVDKWVIAERIEAAGKSG